MQDKKVWAIKHRDDRKNAIVKLLEQKGELLMADLIKKHYEEIGVALAPEGKIVHQAWEVVRTDCKNLEKEKRIVIKKDKAGKIVLMLPHKQQPAQIAFPAVHGKTDIASSKQEGYVSPEMMDIVPAIQALNEKVVLLKNEILEIWKHLSKISTKETLPASDRALLVASVQEILNKLK